MKKFNFLENLLRREFAMSGTRGLRVDAVNSDSQPTVNRQSRLTSVQRHDSVTSARVAREWLNGRTHLRVWLLKIVAVLAILLTIGSGNAWGVNVNFTYTDLKGQGTSGSGSAFTGATKGDITMGGKGYGNNSYVQIYGSGTLTFTPLNGATITKIVLTGTSNTYIRSWNKSSGSSISVSGSTATWTGSATSKVTLTNSASGQARITKMDVTYTAGATSHTLSSVVSPSASGSVSLSATSVTEGSTATATATPATHYVFDHWSISGTGSTLSSTTTNPTTVTMGTANTTVTATFVAAPKASITLSEAGATTTDASTYYVGDSYTLPSSTEASCGTKVLVGWSTVEVAETNTKPTSNFYEKGETVTLAASQTFYAVFATASGGGGAPTAYTAGDEGTYVLAVYVSDTWYALPTTPTVSSGKISGEEITVSNTGGVDYVTSANASGYEWTIADATNGQTISDGTKYLYHSNGGASGTNLAYGDGTTYTWTIESETNGLTFKGTEGSTVRTRGLLASGTTFGGYSLSNEDASGYYRIQVLPIGGMTYSDFNTTCTSCSNSVTVSYSAPGSGNTMTVQKGGASVSSGDALKTCSGVTLTVTLTATTHFTVGGLNATGVTGVTTTNVENVYTVTIPADKTGTLTLTPTFTEDAYRTIVFKSNGSALFNDGGSATTFDGTNKWKQKVYLEAKPVWPTDLTSVQACDGSSTSFRGWVAAGQTWSGKKDAVPAGSTLITDASGFAAAASGSGDVVYHAVWAEASGSGTPHYAKVTSTGDITNGDYLIVYETGSVAFDGSLATLDATSNTIDITISESKITANSTINASKFTIDVANRYIKSASDKYIDQSGWSNGLAGNDAATSVHSMSIDGSGNFVVEGTGNDGAGTPTYVQLKYNAENSQKRFRFYKSGQEDIQLYKYDAGATYSNYLTTCCENYAVTLTGSGVVGGGTFSASSMQPCVGSIVELSATLCSGYTQGAWTVAKTGTPATTVTVTNNQFTMPSYAVTVSLATTAKVDHFIDRMHSTDGYTGDGAERSGCNYTVPNLSNTSEPVGSNCDETHYIFVGWVDADHVGSNGALLSGYSIISGNSTQNATGTTYYAIWAQAL